jgi:hypothetical protein
MTKSNLRPQKHYKANNPCTVRTFSAAKTSSLDEGRQRGDTLFALTLEIYGFTNEGLIYWVRQHNPFITDVNRIEPGQWIVFPEPLEPLDSGKRGSIALRGDQKAPDEEEEEDHE